MFENYLTTYFCVSIGNEYWLGMLASSGDPAAACSSAVAELHNWRINPRISAEYLRVASPRTGTISTFRDYVDSLASGGHGDADEGETGGDQTDDGVGCS